MGAPGSVSDCHRAAQRHARETGHLVSLSEGVQDAGHGLARIWAFWRCAVDEERGEAEELFESEAASPGALKPLDLGADPPAAGWA